MHPYSFPSVPLTLYPYFSLSLSSVHSFLSSLSLRPSCSIQSDGVPLREVAQISRRGATALRIAVFDPSLLGIVSTAIATAPDSLTGGVSLNPVPEKAEQSSTLLVPIPKMTGEARALAIKDTKAKGERRKRGVRSVRQRVLKQIGRLEKGGGGGGGGGGKEGGGSDIEVISEDDARWGAKVVQVRV